MSMHFDQTRSSELASLNSLILLIVFLFLTGPTATHAVASAALVSGMKPKSDLKDPQDSL